MPEIVEMIRHLLSQAVSPTFWDRSVVRIRRAGGSSRDVSLPPGALFFENLYLWERAVMEPVSQRRQDTSVDWFWRQFIGRMTDNVLSLSCGTGYWERHISSKEYAAEIDAVDISPGALRWAEELAREKGIDNIRYRRADLNTAALAPGKYDVVVSLAALHHIRNLEHVLDQIVQSLKPGGYLFFDEYVGPNQMRWPDEVYRIVNEVLTIFPERLRIRARGHSIKRRESKLPTWLWRALLGVNRLPVVGRMLRVDPTEAIRSADIIPLVEKRFSRVTLRPYGGALLLPLFKDIIANFDADRAEDRLILNFSLALERILTREKILSPVFAVGVAQKAVPDFAGPLTGEETTRDLD